ncbi:MAG: nitrous oxide reductase accessory protein NosL [Methylotenera sp.]|nr:nitrous oxide reductase accessory protein NosL [Methylotenera sp.]MDP1755320.1 nitrous oxide reductase accessory protein NosL [Methylotenera sp.]MDP1958852.1 nitrous oxide reductase accessory protein NosL [Methylotenera sp.]MDP3943425.1 nitrous oxide reductase accessory protein NosL [Methylotenera sp.]
MNQTSLIRIALPLILVALLTACNKPTNSATPQEITAGTSCSLDGMTLADFPGPKAQIQYATGNPDYFCDTMEMFSIYLQPEQKKRITGIFTQDMGKTSWEKPQGHWIDAKQAFYVLGSKKNGSMGPTLATFALQLDAEKFAKEFGGKVLPFDKVTPDMVDLTGGVVHDEHM